MNKDSAKAAKEQSGAAPHVVDLRDRVPQMSEDALETLLGNARRLAGTGSKQQQMSAADLIPVLEAELAARGALKAEAAAAKKAAAAAKRPSAKKKVSAEAD
jgi:hypothetical protein